MTDESTTTTGAGAGEQNGETPAAGTTDGGTPETKTGETPGAGEGTTTDDPASWDPDRAKRTIEAQREAERKLKAELAAERQKTQDYEREKLTEAERKDADLKAAKDRAEQLASQLAERDRRDAFIQAAEGLRPKAIPAALALADLQVDDDGTITNLTEAIETLKTEHGYLFGDDGKRKAPPREGGSNAGEGSGNGNDDGVTLTPEQLAMAERAGISPETYAKHL